jgi:hypothetical protein
MRATPRHGWKRQKTAARPLTNQRQISPSESKKFRPFLLLIIGANTGESGTSNGPKSFHHIDHMMDIGQQIAWLLTF